MIIWKRPLRNKLLGYFFKHRVDDNLVNENHGRTENHLLITPHENQDSNHLLVPEASDLHPMDQNPPEQREFDQGTEYALFCSPKENFCVKTGKKFGRTIRMKRPTS
jgi:hypothetical protein